MNSSTKNSDDVDDNCMSFVWFQQDTSLASRPSAQLMHRFTSTTRQQTRPIDRSGISIGSQKPCADAMLAPGTGQNAILVSRRMKLQRMDGSRQGLFDFGVMMAYPK